MDRARRLHDFWDYLPAFRAIAEAEHLPTAARAMGLSPPALSRTLRLLEERLGQPLFDRVERKLRLNTAGRELAVAVRGAMRMLDDGVASALGQRASGTVILGCAAGVGWLLGAWIARLATTAPALVAREQPADGDLGALLRAGDLDVALATTPTRDDGVRTVRLPDVPWRVFRRGTAGAGFVTSAHEPWPANRPRVVVATVRDVLTAAAACGPSARAFLPEPLGRARRLTVGSAILARTPLYLASREPITVHVATELAIAAAQQLSASGPAAAR